MVGYPKPFFKIQSNPFDPELYIYKSDPELYIYKSFYSLYIVNWLNLMKNEKGKEEKNKKPTEI